MDLYLANLVIKLTDSDTKQHIGSGILYNSESNDDTIYLLTAAHCLYYDKDGFANPRKNIGVSFFNPSNNNYEIINFEINHSLVGNSIQKDVAVIIAKKQEIELITGTLPQVVAIKERNSLNSFVIKGFPSATNGKELVTTKPEFNQELVDEKQFLLLIKDDFSTATSATFKVDGFSGSGTFLESNNKLFLYGIFTRFRDAQKVAYCQFIETVNDLLLANYLPTIPFSYIGDNGLTQEFFHQHNQAAIKNLGPRFNEQLNMRLPIAQLFHYAARNNVAQYTFFKHIDNWLLSSNTSLRDNNDDTLSTIKSQINELKEFTYNWLTSIEWGNNKFIEISEIKDRFDVLKTLVKQKQNELYDLQLKERQTQEDKKPQSIQQPYENELSFLRNILNDIHRFLADFEDISFSLVNSPILIIKGEAGCGKSHLLGDVVNENMKTGIASILLLGQLFSTGATVWQNILNQLSLGCTKEELLNSLNSIGKQQGARLLIMIDAINEGPGKNLWRDSLSGLIEDILQYPFIGLVLTIRSTYFTTVVPNNLQDDARITFKAHEGFKGNEYAALKLFCEHHDLITPNFPLLTPEFTSPLFIQLMCQAVKTSGSKMFPQGFHGITKIYTFYIESIYEKLILKRDEYQNRKHIIKDAILSVAQACFDKEDIRMLTIEEADQLFMKSYPSFTHLLNDLINENVFIQTTYKYYDSDVESEMIYFSFERFGDFFIAEKLLNKCTTPEDVKQAFQKGNALGNLLENNYWRNRGVLEAMAVLLPEKYNVEITEVYDWAFDKNGKKHGPLNDWIIGFMWDSILWRTATSIDDKKIIDCILKYPESLSTDEWLLRLTELTAITNHPFNGDRLFKSLNKYTMPERDGFWQMHMRYYSRYAEDGNAFPIRRLLDWAWQEGISTVVDPETARLAGQTLLWLLSSTDRKLRDEATKALVNLLEEQADVLIALMKKFKNIDDLYILERLYAVAYGCTLRTSKEDGVKKIAQYVYNNIFKKDTLPVHVLLRDYARNIVEYAHYKNALRKVDLDIIRPPYNSEFPSTLPDIEEIQQYRTNFEDEDSEHVKMKSRVHGRIHFSTIDWDFGRYTVESAVKYFSPINFTTEKNYKNFYKKLRGAKKDFIKALSSNIAMQSFLEEIKQKGVIKFGDTPIEKYITGTKQYYDSFIIRLKELFNKTEWENIELTYIPYLKTQYEKNEYPNDTLDPEPIKRWIVKRAFELGYNIDIHENYDSLTDSYSHRYDNSVERIGKKYQWIALHEIIARIGDNFYFKDDRKKNTYYQGPWQQYLRDIDPVYITKTGEEQDIEDNLNTTKPILNTGWWADPKYTYWDQLTAQWIDNIHDCPMLSSIINRKDGEGNEWIYLKVTCDWEEPKMLGEDKYNRSQKKMWYMINGYIVHKKDRKKILEWLTKQNFWGRWMPENYTINYNLFNRENYWSPAATMDHQENPDWTKIPNTKYKIMVTTSEAVGEMSSDQSGAHAKYNMPSKPLFDGIEMEYASIDGCFKNSKKEIIASNINPQGVLVRKKELLSFLENNDYEIIWTLLGEKSVINGIGSKKENHFREINGVYYLENNSVIGKMSISKRKY